LSGRLDEGTLLEACLRDQRFDVQVESSRGDWLWQMIRAVGATERFRVPILHALYDLSDECGAAQLCELARRYAETGDEGFRTRLYEIVEQKPFADRPWLGEEEVVGLDGEQGFLFAARVRGRLLADRPWEWDDGSLTDLATERFGAEYVSGLLKASSDEAINRFRENWQQDKERKVEGGGPESDRQRMAATPVEEVVRAAEGEGKCFWLRGWGRYADEAGLQTVLRQLGTEREPRVLANLLKVFSARALPAFDARLVELCRHRDEEVRRRALRAMAQIAHPLIREFALTELQRGAPGGAVIALFVNNYRPGDEQRLLEALRVTSNACWRRCCSPTMRANSTGS
jgi:hypothetical protein